MIFSGNEFKSLINAQLKLGGYSETYDDVTQEDLWFHNRTTTKENQELFRCMIIGFCLSKKISQKISKRIAEEFILQWGLRVKE